MKTQNRSHAVMQQRHEPHDSLDEEWRPIPTWDGYEISNHGRVRSWKQRSREKRCTWIVDYNQPPRILKSDLRNGYPSVLLIRFGFDRSWFAIHRLVLEIFVGAAPEGHEGAHNDGDRTNNRLSNLRWATHIDNNKDKILHGTHQYGERIGSSKLRQAQVDEIRIRRSQGEKTKDLAKEFNVCNNTITNITQRHYWRGLDGGSE